MPTIVVNGEPREAPAGARVLDVLERAGVSVPHLCHDPRVAPAGLCRLCLVEVEGLARPVPACATVAAEGMAIRTHTERLEEGRRTTLALLARRYRGDAAEDTPFLRAVRAYGVEAWLGTAPDGDGGGVRDDHPYLRVDLSRCIWCLRCARICDEVQGQRVWKVLGRGARARLAPDAGRSLLESSCASCGACADTCPTGAIADRAAGALGAPARWTRTTCPYCGVGCELDVGARDGRVVAVRAPLDAPVNRGHLCAKGRYAFGFLRARDRVTTPLLRRDGGWRAVPWSEAIGAVATGLRRTLARYGPGAVGVLGSARGTNEDAYVAQKLARVVLGTNGVDCCARVCHAPSAAALGEALGTGAATGSYDDIERARTILVCGANPTEGHPVLGARIARAARAGAGLVVIDPRRTGLAARADVHVALRPGTNVPLLSALAHVVLAEGLADAAFLRDRVAGLEAFRAAVAPWTPERAAAICEVPPEVIRRAARRYARGPSLSFHGLGVTEHVQGTDAVTCLVNLALLTGNLGKPGAGVNPLRGQNNVQGAAHMGCEPARLTGFAPLEAARPRFEAAWGAALPAAPGLALPAMIDAARAGTLRALWVIGYDVLLTSPAAGETAAALARLEHVVVQDLFLTETARAAGTVFLPAAASFERDGTFMNAERRVQRVRAAVPPPPGARPDWEILCDVARAMGHPAGFAFRGAEEIWDEIRAVWPAGAGITWSRLEAGGLQWPCPTVDHPGTTTLHAGVFAGGERATLRPVAFTPSAEVVTGEYPFLLTSGRALQAFNAGTMTARTPHRLLHPADLLSLHPGDAATLGLAEGDRARVRSRHGRAVLPVHVDRALRRGVAFATFHTGDAFLNRVIGRGRDATTATPEYKVTAVAIERAGAPRRHATGGPPASGEEPPPGTADAPHGGGEAPGRMPP